MFMKIVNIISYLAQKTEWWKNKISQTKERDIQKMEEIVHLGWCPLVIWECELKPGKREQTLNSVYLSITGGEKL